MSQDHSAAESTTTNTGPGPIEQPTPPPWLQFASMEGGETSIVNPSGPTPDAPAAPAPNGPSAPGTRSGPIEQPAAPFGYSDTPGFGTPGADAPAPEAAGAPQQSGPHEHFGAAQPVGAPPHLGAPQQFGAPQGEPQQFGSPPQFGAPQQFAQPQQFGAPQPYGQPGPGGQPDPAFVGGPGVPPPGGPQFAPGYPGPGAQQGPGLDEVALLRKARRAPSRGWRRAVHTLSAGAINPGESSGDIEYQRLLERVNRPVRGDYRIAVLSLKGGVGKTTTTVGLGSTFASLRGDRVIAVDANPDLGTLAQRVPQQTASTVRDLLADQNVYRYSDVRAHTSQAPSRLEVLASERDPAMAEAFSEEEYRGVVTILQRFYNIILTDCGTGLSHSAMRGVLDLANAIILVSSPALDGARSAGATLDWLEAHGYGHLVSRAVVVLSSSRPGSSTIDTDQLGQHFLTRCRAVHAVPFDDHLAEGAEVDLDLVSKGAKRALVELAATIADDFTGPPMRQDPFYG
ncbi:MinD/ParA family protein [Gordonia sp. ABSL1-1]|uniref:MinD/ParA family ATP-binding protein n=1 Tax=Gordonia sp. ABSL1-1 TaxID=3053923 RepID=UPI002572F4E2|nr:MinD/ParA family protein [Gordonia sp. ABSL1-1]MDL9936709.1 MinD/ParA family protein [Gordonia sp. ABSL1-1]